MVQSGRISATVIQNVLRIIKTCLGRCYTSDCRTFPNFPTSALQDGDVSPILRNVQGAAEKKYPLKIFGNISPTTENFKLKFTRFCMFISTQNYKNFIQLFLTFSAIIF